ncbi:MAG: PBSX family phage terminase large subunit [Clostridia bacterium]|nr:PBSX family phage terminase large subunit [Clostridia bacterium]
MLLSPKQIEFVNNATRRWNFKGGATRSGKTYLDFKWIIPLRIRERIGLDGLTVILGVTKSTIERNVLEPMRNIYGDELVGTISSDNTAMLFGEKCYCLGAEKISQVSKIRGASIKYCYGDEVADWSEEVFTLLKSRLDKEYSCFDGTFNPQHPEHWLKQFLDSDADIFSQTYSLDDNPFVPESFKENLKKEYQGTVWFDRYILGLWCRAEGLIYPFFDPKKCCGGDVKGDAYYISCDYGTYNPFSAGLWAVDYEKQTATRIKELYYDGRKERRQLTDREYYEKLLELADDYPIESIVVDPSAASFIAEIRDHGYFDVRQANNSVVDGIRFTGKLLNNGNLRIATRCKNSIKEFQSYAWDEKSTEGDKPLKQNDHAMDDIRYFCYTILKNEGW